MNVIKKIKYCRVCKGVSFEKVLNFGPTPLANAFLTKEQIDGPESYYPLEVYICNNCFFLQLGHVVSPEVLFGNYIYASSTSFVFINHFKQMAESVFSRFFTKNKPFVIDIGSNDGILLRPLKKLGAKVLGIEPAVHIAKIAEEAGIKTIPEFFSVRLAERIVKQNGNADIITATNVFAHIDDLDETIEGIKFLLDRDGIFIIEAPYLIDFIEKKYFDLVYHEHLSYWSINSLITLFKRFNMSVFDVEKVPVHGGTIRVYIKKTEGKHKVKKTVQKFLDQEKEMKLTEKKTYLDYADLVLENKVKLVTLLVDLKAKGKVIAAYGAPAKGSTLLNYFSIGTEILDYVIDDSSWKQGLFMPGKRIPVVSSDTLYEKSPDFLLILAWNFAESIMKMHEKFKNEGGRFIIPVPSPKVIL